MRSKLEVRGCTRLDPLLGRGRGYGGGVRSARNVGSSTCLPGPRDKAAAAGWPWMHGSAAQVRPVLGLRDLPVHRWTGHRSVAEAGGPDKRAAELLRRCPAEVDRVGEGRQPWRS